MNCPSTNPCELVREHVNEGVRHIPVPGCVSFVIREGVDGAALSITTESMGDTCEATTEHSVVLALLVSALARVLPVVVRNLNHDQLLSVLRSHVALGGVLDLCVTGDVCGRCASMNLRQCVDCLSLMCESLDEMALQRISHLLASRHTVLDITPLLNMLCATARASVSDGDAAHVAMCIKRHREDASVTIRGASVLNRTCCMTKLRHSTAQRLELALSLADRRLVVLDDASMLQRRIGKHMQRIAHCVHQAGGQRAASTVDAPVIAARSAVLDYAACFGGSTAHRNGKLHSALLNADQG